MRGVELHEASSRGDVTILDHIRLHYAAERGCLGAVEAMVESYRGRVLSGAGLSRPGGKDAPPWLMVDGSGNTPLHGALRGGHDEVGAYLLALDAPSLSSRVTREQESPLYLALDNGCTRVVDHILSLPPPLVEACFSGPGGATALHPAIRRDWQEGVVRKMIGRLKEDGGDDMIWRKDSIGWMPLHYAAGQGKDWLIEALLQQRRPRAFDNETESPLVVAWNRGHHPAVHTMLRCCPALIEWRGEDNTTLLHHIRLRTREGYRDILRTPQARRVLNVADKDGMTPLHKAVYEGDLILTELLLEMDEVYKSIKNKDGKTAIDILIDKASQSPEFARLRDRPGIIPKGAYISYKSDLKEVKGTVMVVAALLATITFQAAFTIPTSTQDRAPAFVVFLIADTFAMCCSLVVLFWLIWAMVEEDFTKSRKLADRSFFVLEMSFYGTLVAFGAAAFAVALSRSFWLAVVVTVMCCLVPVLSNKTIVSKFFKVKGLSLVAPSWSRLSSCCCCRRRINPPSQGRGIRDSTSGRV